MRRVFLTMLLTLCLVIPSQVWAIAFVSVTNSTIETSVSTQTTSVAVDPTTTALVVCMQNARVGAAATSITSVVFNTSENFTIAHGNAYTPTNGYLTTVWYLLNPTVTTANVVVTLGASTSDYGVASSILQFSGAISAGDPVDAIADGEGNGATVSASITTVAADAWIVDCVMTEDGATVGAGQSQRVNRNSGGLFYSVSTVDGKATPGAETMDWTLSSNHWVTTAVSLTPDAVAPTVTGSGGINRAILGGN